MSEPISFNMPSTLEFNPRTTDEITITIMMPITTPRIVSPDRILLVRIVSQAICRICL